LYLKYIFLFIQSSGTTISTTTKTTTTTLTSTTKPPFTFYSCYSNDLNCGDLPSYTLSTGYTGVLRCQSYCSNYTYFGIQTCSGYSLFILIYLKSYLANEVFFFFHKSSRGVAIQYCECTNMDTFNLSPGANCSVPCPDNSAYSCGDSKTGFSVYKIM